MLSLSSDPDWRISCPGFADTHTFCSRDWFSVLVRPWRGLCGRFSGERPTGGNLLKYQTYLVERSAQLLLPATEVYTGKLSVCGFGRILEPHATF